MVWRWNSSMESSKLGLFESLNFSLHNNNIELALKIPNRCETRNNTVDVCSIKYQQSKKGLI